LRLWGGDNGNKKGSWYSSEIRKEAIQREEQDLLDREEKGGNELRGGDWGVNDGHRGVRGWWKTRLRTKRVTKGNLGGGKKKRGVKKRRRRRKKRV